MMTEIEMYGGNTPIVPDETSDQWELEAKLRRATEKVMKSLPDIIEIDGVKYQKMENTKKPDKLYDLIADWWDEIFVNGNPSGQNIESLVDKIARNWLPEPKKDYRNSWNDGWNSFRQTLIDTLGGD